MIEFAVSLVALLIVLFGLAIIVGGPRLDGRAISGLARVTVQLAIWVLRTLLTVLAAGIQFLTRPRQREPRY